MFRALLLFVLTVVILLAHAVASSPSRHPKAKASAKQRGWRDIKDGEKNFADCEFKELTGELADFRRAHFDRATARSSRLYHADLSFASLVNADFSQSMLNGSKLRSADARGARFKECQLERCDFRGANLTGADFTDSFLDSAEFDGVDLSRTRLKGVSIQAALYDNKTRWPRGFDPVKAGAILHSSPLRADKRVAEERELRPFLEGFEKAWRKRDWQTVSLACATKINYEATDEGFDWAEASGGGVPRFIHRLFAKGIVDGHPEEGFWDPSFEEPWDVSAALERPAGDVVIAVPTPKSPETILYFERFDGRWRLVKFYRNGVAPVFPPTH